MHSIPEEIISWTLSVGANKKNGPRGLRDPSVTIPRKEESLKKNGKNEYVLSHRGHATRHTAGCTALAGDHHVIDADQHDCRFGRALDGLAL